MEWVKEILRHGISAEDIKKNMPESMPYLQEVLGKNIK